MWRQLIVMTGAQVIIIYLCGMLLGVVFGFVITQESWRAKLQKKEEDHQKLVNDLFGSEIATLKAAPVIPAKQTIDVTVHKAAAKRKSKRKKSKK